MERAVSPIGLFQMSEQGQVDFGHFTFAGYSFDLQDLSSDSDRSSVGDLRLAGKRNGFRGEFSIGFHK